MTTVLSNYEIEVSDVEYLRHANKALLARVYKPRGQGPFPFVISLHGGVWCKKDRFTDNATNECLSRSGVVVAALDFRMPPEAGYPASMADINYAIRWFKVHAAEFNTRKDMFGILGVSSGGHQAILAAMRPNDPRYSALPLPNNETMDATLRCAVLCWPVIDPLGRYHYAKQAKEQGNATLAGEDVNDWLTCHDQYWKTEEAMSEGSPTLALERGEAMQMPPVLYLQGTHDEAHPRENLERFVAKYRAAGRRVDLHWFDGMRHAFITTNPSAPASIAALEKAVEFVHREIR